jgi:hypothetical protein
MAAHLLIGHKGSDEAIVEYTGLTPTQLDEIRAALGLPVSHRSRQ